MNFKLTELKQACKLAGVRGYTKLNKENLIDWICNHEQKDEICSHLPTQDVIESPPTKEEIPTGDRGSGRHQNFVAPAKPQRPHPQPTDQPHQNSSQPDREFVVRSPVASTVRAISIQQPWAWAIFHLDKNVENRTWPTTYIGELYIHADQTYDRAGATWIEEKFAITPPEPDQLPKGAIIGRVNLTGCSQNAQSPWAMSEQFHFELDNAELLPEPIPCQGQVGFFFVDILCPTQNLSKNYQRPTLEPEKMLYPAGKWLDENGRLRSDFVEWMAQQWQKSPNADFAQKPIGLVKANVCGYFRKNPTSLLSYWNSYAAVAELKRENALGRHQAGMSFSQGELDELRKLNGVRSDRASLAATDLSPKYKAPPEADNVAAYLPYRPPVGEINTLPLDHPTLVENRRRIAEMISTLLNKKALCPAEKFSKEYYQKAAEKGIQMSDQRQRGILVDSSGVT